MLRHPLRNTHGRLQDSCGGAAEKVLYGILAVFVLILTALVAAVLVRPDAPEFAPTPIQPRPIEGVLSSDTVTIDAADGERWQFFDFDRQSVIALPDTSGWDLAFRRFNVIAAGGVRNLGVVDFAAVEAPPTGNYVSNTLGRDTTNAAIARWYTYGMVSHMLRPRENVFVVRNPNGTYAKLKFLGYYCPGLLAGCVTFQYVYRADGAPSFD
jgi:hypothetical protein